MNENYLVSINNKKKLSNTKAYFEQVYNKISYQDFKHPGCEVY
jgi:hypothetical protein